MRSCPIYRGRGLVSVRACMGSGRMAVLRMLALVFADYDFSMVARMPRGVDQRHTARLFPIVVMPCAFSLSAGEWRGTGTRMT